MHAVEPYINCAELARIRRWKSMGRPPIRSAQLGDEGLAQLVQERAAGTGSGTQRHPRAYRYRARGDLNVGGVSIRSVPRSLIKVVYRAGTTSSRFETIGVWMKRDVVELGGVSANSDATMAFKHEVLGAANGDLSVEDDHLRL